MPSLYARADTRGARIVVKKGAHGGNVISPVKASEPKATETR